MSVLPPPGWYPEGAVLRWWDGTQWGPYAPGSVESEEERGKVLAVVSHVFGGLVSLIIYLLERDKPSRNRFVCHHALEALNFQITFMMVWFGGMIAFVGAGIASTFSASRGTFPVAVFGVWAIMMSLMLVNFGFLILGAVRASQGRWWRYPVSLRLVGRGIDWQTQAVGPVP